MLLIGGTHILVVECGENCQDMTQRSLFVSDLLQCYGSSYFDDFANC